MQASPEGLQSITTMKSQYSFHEPGIYLIQWRPGKFSSNTLAIKVFSNEADAWQENAV